MKMIVNLIKIANGQVNVLICLVINIQIMFYVLKINIVFGKIIFAQILMVVKI